MKALFNTLSDIYRFIVGHPYTITSLVFLFIVLIGHFLLHWQEDNYGFLLLIYFIVTLGIRLDDISKQLGSTHKRATQFTDEENIIGQLHEIKQYLRSVNVVLRKILIKLEQDDPEAPPKQVKLHRDDDAGQ